jgi:hypothetical protein
LEIKATLKLLTKTVWKLILVLVMVLAAFCLVAFLFVVGIVMHDPFSFSDFNQKKWFAPVSTAESLSCYRGSMGNDIVENVLKAGMSHQDVVNLLGPPEREETPRESEYVLGMCSGLGMDYDVLHIYFYQSGKLTHSEILQH